MTDLEAARLLFLGVYDDRVVTHEDLLRFEEAAAEVFYSRPSGWALETPVDMAATALLFGISAWRATPRPDLLWPTAAEGSDAFAYNLLWQMSEHEPDGPFTALRRLPIEQARPTGGPLGDTVGMAFAAGLAVGMQTSPEDDRARSYLASRAHVNEMLLGFTEARKSAAEERRAKLFTFACRMIAADPHATTAAIARAFRAEHRPKAAASTDLEETEIRAWRKSGKLPCRRPRTSRLS